MFKHILASAAMLTVSTGVMAGSADDANAHFKAVAAGKHKIQEHNQSAPRAGLPRWKIGE